MNTIKNFWLRISQLSSFYKAVSLIQVGAAAIGAAWVSVIAMTGDLPPAEVATLSILTLAGLLLCITQLKMLLRIPVVTVAEVDMRFGLTYDSLTYAFNPDPTHGLLQLGLTLSNNSVAPIRFEVERFDVVIGNITLPASSKSYKNMGSVIGVGRSRVFRDVGIPIHLIAALVGKSNTGQLEAHIKFGRAGDDWNRRYKLKLELTVHLGPQVGVADVLLEEIDEPL